MQLAPPSTFATNRYEGSDLSWSKDRWKLHKNFKERNVPTVKRAKRSMSSLDHGSKERKLSLKQYKEAT